MAFRTLRERTANRVLDLLKAAAITIVIAEPEADRFVLRGLLIPAVRHKDHKIIQTRNKDASIRTRRRRQRLSRAEQRRKGIYGRPQS
jgi:hypothetical protein